ncbi:MAG: class I SAM-dependent methyltransferase [Candidatus Omnitrophica bacterium]|nr:class I SAM-dependent methyltransferase [Candidatus Omnitrophota bacterium]
MFKKKECDICGSTDREIIYSSKKISQNSSYFVTEENLSHPSRIARCNNCGFIFAIPSEDPNVFFNAYIKMVDEKYVEEEFGRRLSARSILRKLNRFKKSGNKLLDIGCCTGFLLDEARNMGWDTSGVELSTWASRYATEKFNLKIYNMPLEKVVFPNEYFDIIIMQDTIEHLQYPRQALLEANRILKTNGILYINTPDIVSFTSKILKAKWWGINQFHLYYFSKKSLSEILNLSGFVVLKYDAYARIFTLNYWSERFRNYNSIIYRILKIVIRIKIFKKSFLRVNLRDQVEVFARKVVSKNKSYE